VFGLGAVLMMHLVMHLVMRLARHLVMGLAMHLVVHLAMHLVMRMEEGIAIVLGCRMSLVRNYR
jgi:hypothetical protein